MIQRLRLQNWRAYDNLDLEFGPGATYVVASNGIGKTSLIMGAAWGLLGDASEVNAAEQIRGDAESATVQVDVRLPSGDSLSISRSVDRRGRVELSAEVGETVITEQDELDDLLATESGADVRVLAQLTFMIHGGSLETAHGEFQLQDHLASVFGVTPLFKAAATAEATARAAASTLAQAEDGAAHRETQARRTRCRDADSGSETGVRSRGARSSSRRDERGWRAASTGRPVDAIPGLHRGAQRDARLDRWLRPPSFSRSRSHPRMSPSCWSEPNESSRS